MCRSKKFESTYFWGFRVYQTFWTPEKRQLLNCFHESRNVFHPLLIVCERNSEKTGRIFASKDIIVERGATVDVELTSDITEGRH